MYSYIKYVYVKHISWCHHSFLKVFTSNPLVQPLFQSVAAFHFYVFKLKCYFGLLTFVIEFNSIQFSVLYMCNFCMLVYSSNEFPGSCTVQRLGDWSRCLSAQKLYLIPGLDCLWFAFSTCVCFVPTYQKHASAADWRLKMALGMNVSVNDCCSWMSNLILAFSGFQVVLDQLQDP